MAVRIHPTSLVSEAATVGDGTQIWVGCQVRENVRIGRECMLGKNIYIDPGVTIGARVKIGNNVSLFTGVTIEDGAFIGPHVCFTNDMLPRAINPDGSVKGAGDWHVTETRVKYGAAIGANSTIRCGVTLGEWSLVAAGSVVTKDVPSHGLVRGNPARLVGYVCACAQRLPFGEGASTATCACGRVFTLGPNGAAMRAP